MGIFYGKALILDNTVKFVEGIKGEEKLLIQYSCLFAKNLKDASQFLKQSKHNIRVVFLSSSIGPSHGLDELSEIRKEHPLLPVVLISHRPEREPKEIFEDGCGFRKILRSPENFSCITNEIDELFSSQETWTDIEVSKDEKNVELNLVNEDYIPTFLADFVLTPKSFFNIYIKLGQSKFIKILNAGDPLLEDLIKTYRNKGVTHLYISTEEHRKYIRFCEESSKKILQKQDINLSKKIHNVLNLGANISQSLAHSGISQEKLDLANTFLTQSVDLIKNIRMKNESLKNFIDSIEKKEHCAAVSFLAGMIANEVGIESSKAIKLVGIAALLHDIGLYDIDPDFKEQDLGKFNEEQQKIYEQHQKHGGEILRKCGGFDEVIYQAVESHHMRRRGTDPSNRSNNINMVTEVIGAADELHNIVMTKNFNDQNLNYFLATNLKNYSPQIERAVLKLLQIKKAA